MSILTQRKKIGDVMIERGLIRREWVTEILEHAKNEGVRFGEAAVSLGYLTEEELRVILLQPYKNETFFQLEPEYFPSVTKDLFTKDQILRHGVLPLGYKSEFRWFRSVQRLNIGMLNPARTKSLDWVRQQIPNVKSFKTFQILPDQFLATLEQHYGVGKASLMGMGPENLDENLTLYLQLERRQRPRKV